MYDTIAREVRSQTRRVDRKAYEDWSQLDDWRRIKVSLLSHMILLNAEPLRTRTPSRKLLTSVHTPMILFRSSRA